MIPTITALAIALAAAAPAQDAAQQDTTKSIGQALAKSGEMEEGERIKCRYIRELGSRIPNRICRTRAEWAVIREEQREASENNMRNIGSGAERGTIYGADGLRGGG